MTTIPRDAQLIIDRLAALDYARPVVDRARVEAAIREHFVRLGVEPLPVVWADDAERALSRVFSAARSAAWSAAESAAWSAAWSAARESLKSGESAQALDRWIGIWLPFVDAYEAGLWLFFVTETCVVAVPRPALQIVDDRLHCASGPAVQWPHGASYYFLRGVQVDERIVLRPETVTAEEITECSNAEVRRILLSRFGEGRYLEAIDARCVHRDETGELYRAALLHDESLCMVKVLNSTPEPDGSIKTYWLRVPPDIRRAREGVAWTFGLREQDYRPVAET